MSEPSISIRAQSRRNRLRTILDELSALRLCGPSDDPDEQTSVVESYRYLLIHIKRLSKGLVSNDIMEQLEALPNSIGSIYDVYQSKANLDAIAVDLTVELEDPLLSQRINGIQECLISPALIDALMTNNSTSFDLAKLVKLCAEINSSYYNANLVACLLLMRTVLNYVPPIFGYSSFTEVVSNAAKSLKDNLEHLDSGLRKLADLYAHQPIRQKEHYLVKGQLYPYRPQFELLLQEIVVRLH